MKTTKLFITAAMLLTLVSCASEDVNKEDKDCKQKDKVLTTFASGESVTRTSMDYNIGGKGKFFWTTGDKIWVDNGATPIPSSTSSDITGKTAYAQFYFGEVFSNASYPVYYSGNNAAEAKKVTIATIQTQSAPNNTEHLTYSGDCGIGTATKTADGVYKFKLKHQGAYLCFQPRSTDVYVHRSKLIKIEIISEDNDIAGAFTLTSAGLVQNGSGSKTITLITGSGFDLDNTNANLDKNGAYAIIAPGTHRLQIRYWLRNTTDHLDTSGNVATLEGTVTKEISGTFDAGKVYDITANLNPQALDDEYYMWDAQREYWADLTDVAGINNKQYQPKTNGLSDSHYPQNNADTYRWRNESLSDASQSCKDCPTTYEVLWYYTKGSPHSDKDELFSVMGHLYSGGFWFKKQSVIADENGKNVSEFKTTPPDNSLGYIGGHPLSTSVGKPEYISKYFFLPAAGYYNNGTYNLPAAGGYWMSTPNVSGMPVLMLVSSMNVIAIGGVGKDYWGCRTWKAQ